MTRDAYYVFLTPSEVFAKRVNAPIDPRESHAYDTRIVEATSIRHALAVYAGHLYNDLKLQKP